MAPKKTGHKPRSTSGVAEQTGTESSSGSPFPIVGVGASAGGLEAFTQLFRHLPVDPGMAFVLIQHLAPAHESMLTELLSKTTAMPVKEVKDGMTVEPNTVYVIPPDSEMVIFQGALHLSPREKTRGQYMPVDSFLRSLAQDRRNNAIAVIMSGSGSDGASGIRAVKGEGGIVFAQDETAKYDGMPKSAIDTGCVDFVLPPDKIAAELLRIRRHPYLAAVRRGEPVQIIPADENDLNKIFIMLRSARGVDFTSYKRTTIMRRVNRRMLLQKIERMEKYVAYLKENPSEIETLYQDILINVTSFFREPEAFEALKRSVFPFIVNKAADDVPVRIWVPACSTGEEAYSIAIAFIEYMDDNKISRPVQIFATDIDDLAVDKARKGIYPENISRDVSPERLSRFFEKTGGVYVIKKFVREMCIFAKQNIVKDPPFSKIDLISCRNLLIYFGSDLQKKVIRILFYALNPKGFLMIGPSETVGEFAGLFSVADKKNTIYAKKAEPSMQYFEVPAVEYGKEKAAGKRVEVQSTGVLDIQKEADNIVLAKYSPAGFVVNENMKILQFRGDTGPYLRPAPGEASLNLLKMVSEDLVAELRTALHQAKKGDAPVRKERARVKHDKRVKYINIDIVPFKAAASGERCFLVLFEETAKSLIAGVGLKGGSRGGVTPPLRDEEAVRLRQELAESKAHLNTVTQEYEAANEELRALNEELQSSNEEMQSINEEMETAKEELQSTNEELTTVNDELQSRNEETTQLNNDLFNVLRGVEIPIVLLGSQLQIRRFNDAAARLLNLIPSDTGRPLSNIRSNINIPDLEQMVLDTISTLSVKEKEVQDTEDRWYSLTVRPYKTVDNRIDGVLMTLVDITDIKRTLLRVEVAYDYANAIVETVRESLLVLDRDLRVMTANKSFYENFLAVPEATQGRYIYELGNGQWNIPDLMKQLREVLPEKKSFSDFEVTIEFPNAGRRVMILNARKIYLKEPYFKAGLNMTGHFDRLILLAIEDITERKQTEEALLKSSAFNQSIIDNSTDCIKLLDLEGRLQYMSPGGQRLLGIPDMGKFMNVSYPEFWKGTDHQAALEAIHQAQQGHPATFQGYCPTIDGTPKWWDVAISPIVGADGNPERLLAVSRDITERRRAEEALQASFDRYRSYIEVTGQLGWTANPDGEVVEDLPSWRIYTGQTYEEIKGRGWSKTLHPEDYETALQIWEKAVTEKSSFEVECRIRRHDGVYRHFMVRGIPVLKEDGSVREWVGTCIDITERRQEEELLRDTLAASQQRQSEISALKDKLEIRVRERTADLVKINQDLEAEIVERTRAEEAVETEKQRLYDVLDTLPVYVVLLARDYHVPFANRFFRERFGESYGKRCFEYLFGRSEPCETCETYTALKTMAPHHWEWTGPDKRNYDVFDFPFTDSDGSTLILEMGIDITAQKQAEKEIIKINQELEQRVTARTAELEAVNKELEAFSYTVSHDLKTPLRSIQGFAQAIVEDYSDKLDDAGRDYLRRLTSAGKRMTQLIDAMLSISRLTRRELMGKAVNLSSFAEVIAYELKKNDPGRAAEFIIAKGLKAHGDADMLEIALRNLFDNAWKFTGKHASARIEFGAIECGVRNAECGTIPNSETGKTVYFVSDDGSGFSMQYADKLFQPFKRLHTESEFPGLGIGLATVSKIINKHGGKIWAEAEPEKGATFYFTLE